MNKSNLYTRTGDLGTTSLVGGQRVSKSSVRLEAYGTVDELNAWIGVLASDPATPSVQVELLYFIQHRLFDLGAYLATEAPDNSMPLLESLSQSAISRIEHAIDTLDDATPKVNRFVLPSGTQLAAWAHVARTVCRRAERRIIELKNQGAYIDPSAIRFINRLSDYLFILARNFNHISDTPEIFWSKDC